MVVQLRGIVRGRQIELDQATGLQDGVAVDVRIEPTRPSVEELRAHVDRLRGAWAADDSIPAIFAEIEASRAIKTSNPAI